MRNLANGEYGEKIWEEKIKVQNEVGVIHGTVSTLNKVNEETKRLMNFLDRNILFKIKKGGHILDAGVGPMARFSIEFAKRGYNVTRVDISKTTLKFARQYIKKERAPVNLIKDDITKLSNIRDGTIDFIFCIETFFHIPPHLSGICLTNFNRKLKNNGLCLIQFGLISKKKLKDYLITPFYWGGHYLKRIIGKGFNVNVSRFTRKEIEEMIKASGFKIKGVYNNLYLIKKDERP